MMVFCFAEAAAALMAAVEAELAAMVPSAIGAADIAEADAAAAADGAADLGRPRQTFFVTDLFGRPELASAAVSAMVF